MAQFSKVAGGEGFARALIETSAFEESFLAVHDAWQGTPRIMVAYDKMIHVPKLVGIGALRFHYEGKFLKGLRRLAGI